MVADHLIFFFFSVVIVTARLSLYVVVVIQTSFILRFSLQRSIIFEPSFYLYNNIVFYTLVFVNCRSHFYYCSLGDYIVFVRLWWIKVTAILCKFRFITVIRFETYVNIYLYIILFVATSYQRFEIFIAEYFFAYFITISSHIIYTYSTILLYTVLYNNNYLIFTVTLG